MKDIIQDLNISNIKKQSLMKLAQNFQEHMPDSLYLDHYELAELLDFPPQITEEFLDIPEIERFINAKVAKLNKANARKAFQKLAKGNFQPQEVTALKELIDKSEMLNQDRNPRVYVLTNIPQGQEVK